MKTLILSATVLFAAVSPALAASPNVAPQAGLPTLSIPYADLNLHDAQGAATMLKRIRKASAAVCTEGSAFVGNDAETIRRGGQCYRQSVARAGEGLNAPLVTQAYAGKPGKTRLAGLQ